MLTAVICLFVGAAAGFVLGVLYAKSLKDALSSKIDA